MSGGARLVGGRYRLSGWLGRGGMGAVWAAHDTLLGRDVALKEIFLPEDTVAPDDPSIRRAFREARAAARLRHRGIVTVHDVVTDDGRPWIVMELIDGPSLAAAIREHGKLPEHRAADIGLQVLDALRTAHRQGVLHRDVKPANILLGADRVVLTDFGIAAIDDATSITSTGQMIGSPAFLAPERFHGRPATAATDLWALGVTLYTAVTGRTPFPADDLPGTLAAILHRSPEPPADAGPLWPVIEGLLAKDPEARLTADQAHPLLSAVVRTYGERPGNARSGPSLSADPQLPPTLPEQPSPVAPTIADPHEGILTAAVPSPARPASATPPDTAPTIPEPGGQPAIPEPGREPLITRPSGGAPTTAPPAGNEPTAASPLGNEPTAMAPTGGRSTTAHPPGAGWPGFQPAGDRSAIRPVSPGPATEAGGPFRHPGWESTVQPSRRPFPWQAMWVVLLVVSTLVAAGAIIRATWLQLDGSAAPKTGTSAGTGAEPSGTPSSEPPQAVPGAFIGEWSGTAKQPIGTVSSWEVVITFTATSRTGSFFTSLNCTGTLTVVAPWPTDREVHLHQQTGWNPRQTCVDEADITLTLDDDGQMEMRWQDLGNASNQATASLTRS
jgi:serine/threonine protein kinase